jgi:hypothetical protein
LEDALTIRLNSDIPDDFEEYCEMHLKNPNDPICRMDYLIDLKRADRFKKFLTIKEIRSMPILHNNNKEYTIMYNDNNNNKDNSHNNNNKPETIDLNNKVNLDLLGFEIVWLTNKKEYDGLVDLQNTLEYYAKIVESYNYDPSTGNYDTKKFSITKEDMQMKNIAKDFKNYFKSLEEYYNYLKELIKRYNIRRTENTVRRLAFNINSKNNTHNMKQQHPFKFITAVMDWQDFS